MPASDSLWHGARQVDQAKWPEGTLWLTVDAGRGRVAAKMSRRRKRSPSGNNLLPGGA